MRRILCALMAVWSLSSAAQAQDTRPPLTAQERLLACEQAEDGSPERALALADSVLAESMSVPAAMRGTALGCRGWALIGLGRTQDARNDAAELQALVQTLPSGPQRLTLLRRAGGILHRSGDRIGAVDLYGKALAEAEAAGLEAERIPILINLGVHHSEFEEHERARVNYEQALALMDLVKDHRYEAPVRFNLGLTLNGQRKYLESLPHLERSLALIREGKMGGPEQALQVELAYALALQRSGQIAPAQEILDRIRKTDLVDKDIAVNVQVKSLDAERLVKSGRAAEAVALLKGIQPGGVRDLVYQDMQRQLADAQQEAGMNADAVQTMRGLLRLREDFMRGQNHERVAALEAHLRDREQRTELQRLQQLGALQSEALERTRQVNWIAGVAIATLLLVGAVVFAWQRRMNRRLDRVSRTDPLTGLSNRRDMTERMRALTGRSPAESRLMCLFVIDIDHFKAINDRHGHDAGDHLLHGLAQRLRAALRSEDAVARWGGEEFLVCAQINDLQTAELVAERIRMRLAAAYDYRGNPLQATVSIGFAPLPLPGATESRGWQSSMIVADAALYMAKSAGRDGWAGFWVDRAFDEWPAERIAHEIKLARARGVVSLSASKTLPEPLSIVA